MKEKQVVHFYFCTIINKQKGHEYMNELEKLQKQIEIMDKRITALEQIISGTASGKVGRKFKLTPEQKLTIIERHSSGDSYSTLAEEYSVSRSTICNICKGCQENRMIVDVITCGMQK